MKQWHGTRHDKHLKMDGKTDKIKWIAISVTKNSTEDICISYQSFPLLEIYLICLCHMIANTIYVQEEETVWCLEEVIIIAVWIVRYVGTNMLDESDSTHWKISRYSFLVSLWIHVMSPCFWRYNHIIRGCGLTMFSEASWTALKNWNIFLAIL